MNAIGGTGAASGTGTSSSSGGQGNQQLQQSFNDAMSQAQQTLAISTSGQAQLNALRARPQ